MLELFIRYFEKGDTKSVLDSLSHSAFWQQHDFRAYGTAQIGEALNHWLAIVGQCSVTVVNAISQDAGDVLIFSLSRDNSDQTFTLALDIHHNKSVIKFVKCTVNTQELAHFLQQSLEQLGEQLPEPDHLVISDYDHQNHFQQKRAIPSVLLPAQHPLADMLDKWWTIWSEGQLSEIEELYTENIRVLTPNNAQTLGWDPLFDALRCFRSQYKRPFCQLAKVATKDNVAVVHWYFEGDPKSQNTRERIGFCSVVEFNHEQRIQQERLISDVAAHSKRFPNSKRSKLTS